MKKKVSIGERMIYQFFQQYVSDLASFDLYRAFFKYHRYIFRFYTRSRREKIYPFPYYLFSRRVSLYSIYTNYF